MDEEYTERDRIVTDIVERIKKCDLAAGAVKSKEKKERATAEGMRKQATERLGKTRRRRSVEAELNNEDEGILVIPE